MCKSLEEVSMITLNSEKVGLYEYAREVVTRVVREELKGFVGELTFSGRSQEDLVQELYDQISQKIVEAFGSDSKIMKECSAEGRTVEDLKNKYGSRVIKSVENAVDKNFPDIAPDSNISMPACVIS